MLDFVIKVAGTYRKDQRASDFIPDLLQLRVPNLFSSSSEPGADKRGLIKERFSDFLKSYIRRNNLRPVIMTRIQDILGVVSEDTADHVPLDSTERTAVGRL